MSEYKLHVAVVKHINLCFASSGNPGLKWWHTPNQTRDATEAFFNKQMGVLPGVPDLIFSWPTNQVICQTPRPVWMGAIELKAPGKKTSSHQNKFLSSAASAGWHTRTCWSVEQVHKALISWGLKPAYKVSAFMEPDLRTKEQKDQDFFDMYKR